MDLLLLVVNFLLALLAAPVITGMIKKRKAGWQNRVGPGILQPWFDILKYLSKESVVSKNASWIFRVTPYIYFSCHLLAVGIVPLLLIQSPLSAVGDAIVVIGLLALARFALALAALDTGGNFGGMGASRELAFAALVEPAMMLAVFALALPAGSTSLSVLAASASLAPSRLIAFAGMFIVAIAETGRLPIDNPDTHLELTMAHEGMLLEYSGRPLALLLWATHVKQLVVLSLMATLFFPWGIASEPTLPALLIALASYLFKLVILAVALAFVETTNVKLRIFRIPDLLGAASLLGIMAVTSVYLMGT